MDKCFPENSLEGLALFETKYTCMFMITSPVQTILSSFLYVTAIQNHGTCKQVFLCIHQLGMCRMAPEIGRSI